MDGLEISETNYSQLRESIIGSDFNGKRKKIALKKINSIEKIEDYFDLHSDNIKGVCNVLDYDLTHTLGNFLHDVEISDIVDGQRKFARENDFIISRLRSYLKEFAIVKNITSIQQVFSTEYLVYRAKTNKISTNTLLAYCLTKEVQTILNCSQYGTEHPRFYDFVFNEMPLPNVLLKINGLINLIFNKIFEFRANSLAKYKEAENILTVALGLDSFIPSASKYSIRKLSDSFGASGRLDAEYYQKKYDDYLQKISSFSHTYIKNEFSLIKTPVDKSKQEYPYVEIGDINIGDGTFNYNIIPTKELPANAKICPKQGDLLVSKVRPYRGAVALINKKIDSLIVSGAFSVLRSKSSYETETLLVLLRTNIYKDWLLKWNVGTSYPVINDNDVMNMSIPIIDNELQTQISEKVRQSFALRRQSERLLERAKQAVEIAIEQGEEKAMDLLKQDFKLSFDCF